MGIYKGGSQTSRAAVVVGQDIWQMRNFSVALVILMLLAACAPEESARVSQMPEGARGKAIIFKSNVDAQILALYPDHGHFLFYGDVSEVDGPSDLGGRLAPCGEGMSKCVEFADSIYFMVPPQSRAGWDFGGYSFRVPAGSSGSEGHLIVVSRDGAESYSYSYSSRCGVEWINFSSGGEGGEKLYYPIGRSLFSEATCPPHP
jgi:hypothetical protein